MAMYKLPGVYIAEVSTAPPPVTGVETAVPAFIGFTEKTVDENGASLINSPVRINSLQEYERLFGRAPAQPLRINITQRRQLSSGRTLDVNVAFDGAQTSIPDFLLYYSLQLFFANGGRSCLVVSIGDTADTDYDSGLFKAAIAMLEEQDEPTLYVFPDACSHRAGHTATDADVGSIVTAALVSCARRGDRFAIVDVRNAIPGGPDNNAAVDACFRHHVPFGNDVAKYGAAYFPYLETSIALLTSDARISISRHDLIDIAADGSETRHTGHVGPGTTLADAINAEPGIYQAVRAFIRTNATVTLPPSGAVAGIYSSTDESRGVWKAPANVSLAQVIRPALTITNEFNADLNVDPVSGKSINAIRAFTGKGTLVWGARTLAGNDSEWRYVPVRRFISFVEKSVKAATTGLVSRPNDASTWTAVRAMIEEFLIRQWRAGALAGAKPEHAFYVRVGLGQTMSEEDIRRGRMIVEMGLAPLRPAEFIVLRIQLQIQWP